MRDRKRKRRGGWTEKMRQNEKKKVDLNVILSFLSVFQSFKCPSLRDSNRKA